MPALGKKNQMVNWNLEEEISEADEDPVYVYVLIHIFITLSKFGGNTRIFSLFMSKPTFTLSKTALKSRLAIKM